MPKRTPATDPAAIAGVSVAAVHGFLLQAAELDSWTPDYASKTLAVDKATAHQVNEAVQVIGYVEPIPGRRSAYRTTEAGNRVAGVSKALDAEVAASTASCTTIADLQTYGRRGFKPVEVI